MTAMFKAMKRAMLLMSAQKQGYNTYAKNKTWKAKPTEEKSALLRNYREEKVAEWEKYGDVAFLPPHWLTFLLCSLPMMVYFPNKKMTLDCLVPRLRSVDGNILKCILLISSARCRALVNNGKLDFCLALKLRGHSSFPCIC